MCYCLHDIEQKQNIRFPEQYKRLYHSNFCVINDGCKLQINEEKFNIIQFLSATEIIHALDEFYDFWGYDIVPIAEVEYGDYICLYYKECRNVPKIVYWNYELALENSEEAILHLFDNIDKFEMALRN